VENLALNKIPHNTKHIHLTACCGTGMGALACMLKELGYDITGSDQKVYPPMSEFLSQKGIRLMNGFSPQNLTPKPDLVVIGNAVTRDNPEAQQMIADELNYCSMPQAINHFFAADKKRLVVTGTHGKTTTSSILAWLLQTAGLDPSFMIGGILKNFGSNYRLGNGPYIVLEGDEYDTAFFDKGPKFMHYPPFVAVLTSVEFDHADIFRDLDHVISTFDRFLDDMGSTTALLAYDDDLNVNHLVKGRHSRVLKYGQKASSPWQLGQIDLEPPWSFFEVFKNGVLFARFKTKLIGMHNLLNALACIAIADRLHISAEKIAEALETFEGVKRRQEIRGIKNQITVIDDFAHHPTAVRETVRAVKPFYPGHRLVAVFEPRTNSSMRDVFQSDYAHSFDDADLICIPTPALLEKIPVHERFSSEKLVDDLNKRDKKAYHFNDATDIIAFLKGEARPKDVILIMSNGSFDNIHARLLQELQHPT
jgi:UDP-N-acetylmuramate: L-alanyl-gamma-D-glutamyl-meso-diaminopimelate ligase